MCVYVRTYVRTHTHTYTRTYVHTFIHTYVRTYVCVCVERERQTDGQTEVQFPNSSHIFRPPPVIASQYAPQYIYNIMTCGNDCSDVGSIMSVFTAVLVICTKNIKIHT